MEQTVGQYSFKKTNARGIWKYDVTSGVVFKYWSRALDCRKAALENFGKTQTWAELSGGGASAARLRVGSKMCLLDMEYEISKTDYI